MSSFAVGTILTFMSVLIQDFICGFIMETIKGSKCLGEHVQSIYFVLDMKETFVVIDYNGIHTTYSMLKSKNAKVTLNRQKQLRSS